MFETFLSFCPMRFFVKNWHTKNQGHKKGGGIRGQSIHVDNAVKSSAKINSLIKRCLIMLIFVVSNVRLWSADRTEYLRLSE